MLEWAMKKFGWVLVRLKQVLKSEEVVKGNEGVRRWGDEEVRQWGAEAQRVKQGLIVMNTSIVMSLFIIHYLLFIVHVIVHCGCVVDI